MKATDYFKRDVQAYLEQYAESDVLFAVSYRKPQKNIDDCITYILNAVQKSGCNGFADAEIFSMAVHYYDEDNIAIGSPPQCQVVVNRTIGLTEEEKAQARKDAIDRVYSEYYAQMKQPLKKSHPKQAADNNQLNLFDL